ncbi:hypothetical protein Lesp02_84210 [Lentzea sp. NBRC 105346]|uniref:hypothetical protein n=1 Tax=Lentzea sp. NBRC 105346 TaxID=3032205 RepID=UPI0024A2778C|nr:hypothetical protein [Lentzea sp. NBRC 105346]GLZ36234.1 hypothetical protein Lesp02_84210 [Lentzea sp. NBRC 105346]
MTTVTDPAVQVHTRCAIPGCHNLLRPSEIPRVCTAPCNITWLAAMMSRSLQEAFRVLTPAFAAMAEAFRHTAEHIGPLLLLIRLRPKRRSGPLPLCIDGHAYRNRTRRRTRKNRR